MICIISLVIITMPILWQQLIICCAYNQLPFESTETVNGTSGHHCVN